MKPTPTPAVPAPPLAADPPPPSPSDPWEDPEIAAFLLAGTSEHYQDAALYDHEYRRRRRDLHHYRRVCHEVGGASGAAVLELGCGTGRLLVPLLRDGHRVVGVDRERPMLARCQERLSRLPPRTRARARLIQADFRELPVTDDNPGRFPVILCPFNAFMHLYSRADAERFLHQVRAHLAPGGLFAFDVLNPDLSWLVRSPERRWSRTRFRHPTTGQTLIYTTNHSYDQATQVNAVRIYYDAPDPRDPAAPPRAVQVVHLAQRQYFPAELEALLHYNGFALEGRAGDFDGGAFTSDSSEQVIRARVR